MVDTDEVRSIGRQLLGAVDESTPERLMFSVAGHRIAWTFLLRIHPKKARVPHLPVLVIHCPLERKDLLVEAAPDTYFDDDHYRGFPAIMVRLEAIDAADLRSLLEDAAAWAVAAPAKRGPSR